MPPAAIAAVAVAGAVAQGIGQQKQAKAAKANVNRMAANYDPNSIEGRAKSFNPFIYNAMFDTNNAAQQGGFQGELGKIAQDPGYIDPRLMNQAYAQSNQGANSDMARAQSILGTTLGGSGTSGVGDMYALANQAARTSRNTGLSQQYSLWREGQKRQDINYLMGEWQNALGMGMNSAAGANQALSNYQPGPNSWGNAGNAISSGISAYGAAKGMGMGGAAKGLSVNQQYSPNAGVYDSGYGNKNTWAPTPYPTSPA